jgi:pilus assembly protein CpaF
LPSTAKNSRAGFNALARRRCEELKMHPDTEKLTAAYKENTTMEMLINADGSVFVERPGAALETLPFKPANEAVGEFIRTLVGNTEHFGADRPYADLSAPDGSRVHVILPPIARGICLSVRKRPAKLPTLNELTKIGGLTAGCAGFLKFAVDQGKNLLIVGGTSSGKTTLLNALISLVNPKHRILILEDSPELAVPLPHVVYLKTRIHDSGGNTDVTLRDLVSNSLRMRPDRLIIGECRGAEAADMLQAMNIGTDGVMATLHANSAREGLQRLETLTMMSGMDLPLKALRQNIVQAVDLVVFTAKLADGTRRVCQVSEVTGMDGETVTMSDLFKLESRKTPGGAAFTVVATGAIPRFYDQLRASGGEPPLEFFKKD